DLLGPSWSRLPDPQLMIRAGVLLPGFYDDWVLDERDRLGQLRVHALEALCKHLTTRGRYGQAVAAGMAAVAAEPFRESAQVALIRAHLAEGNRADAVRQFARYCRV